MMQLQELIGECFLGSHGSGKLKQSETQVP